MSKCVSAYNPISDKTITICLWEIPINMTIIELNGSDDNSADEFCGWLRESYDKTPRKIPFFVPRTCVENVGNRAHKNEMGHNVLGLKNEMKAFN